MKSVEDIFMDVCAAKQDISEAPTTAPELVDNRERLALWLKRNIEAQHIPSELLVRCDDLVRNHSLKRPFMHKKDGSFTLSAATKDKDPAAHMLLADMSRSTEPRMAAIHLTQAASQSRNGAWGARHGRVCLLDSLHASRVEAAYQLGMAYLSGDLGLEVSLPKARSWLQCAAAAGHMGALEVMDGDGVPLVAQPLPVDLSTWADACSGDVRRAEGAFHLARCLLTGDHVVKDPTRGAELLAWLSPYHQRACVSYAAHLVDTKLPAAKLSAAKLPAAVGKSVQWLERHLCVEMLTLQAAIHMVEVLAKRAEYSVGMAMVKPRPGGTIDQLWKQALQLLRGAAREGSTHAQRTLGLCYEMGCVEARDQTKALTWYKKASVQGDAEGQYKAGCLQHATAKEQGLPLGECSVL